MTVTPAVQAAQAPVNPGAPRANPATSVHPKAHRQALPNGFAATAEPTTSALTANSRQLPIDAPATQRPCGSPN